MKSEAGSQRAERVLVCFAMKEEAGPFRKMVADKSNISILIVGIGRKNAERAIRDFLGSRSSRGNEAPIKTGSQSESPDVVSYRPDLVLTCGFAGGLSPALKLGDVVFEFGTRNREPGTQSEPPDVGCCGVEQKLVAIGVKPAKFFCADRIATTVAEKKKLRDETGADAVEMESAAIHAVCVEQGIPCVTVRVISDTAHEDLPLDFNRLAKPDQSLDFGKLFLAIAKSPGKIPALMQLGKKTKFAAEQLAGVLEKITVQSMP